MTAFETGKTYDCTDRGFDPITVMSRTPKFVTVTNNGGRSCFRTKVCIDTSGNEYIMDRTMPAAWQEILQWRAGLERIAT